MKSSGLPGSCKYRFIILLIIVFIFEDNQTISQEYSSDSWLSKAQGTITIIPTTGQRNTMLMTTYSLFPKWKLTMAAYLYNNDNDPTTNDGYITV